jgi:3-methyladenine DNA glycosylase/8-oxoguanine DNA glycosylase
VVEVATTHLARVDPAFAGLVKAVPYEPRVPDGDYFNTLARAVVYQQLAGRAAAAIHGRFLALYKGHATPEAVLQTDVEHLRAVGLSLNKATSIRDLALKVTDGTVPLDRIDDLEDEDIISRLSAVRGIGRWTAEMFLIFHLKRMDVWPIDDYGVRKGYARIHALNELPKPKELAAAGEIYKPYRSVAAWYCWRAVDTVLPD